MLKGDKTNITKALPQILGWVDDSHFLINKKENIDSFELIKFNKLQDFIDNDSKRSLNSYYSSIR